MTTTGQQIASQTDVVIPPSQVTCPACGAHGAVDFYDCGRLPVHIGVLWDDVDQARRAPMGEVLLSYCPRCDFVFNRSYDPDKIWFEPGFEVALHHSPVFREFMEGVADRLIENFDLHDKDIVEIGCGCGWFLRQMCRRGGNRGIGIDPTVACEGSEIVGEGSVRFIRDYFTAKYADLPFDFVGCLSVFEDIPHPQAFLQMVRRMIGDRRDVGIYFEVFNAYRALQARETWSINYEQCNYFGERSFTSLFSRCGFEVLKASPCYQGDQYLYVEALPGAFPDTRAGLAEGEPAVPAVISRFGEIHRGKIEFWNGQLAEFRRAGRRAVVWGSGGKGLNFLNALPTAGLVEFVVDINPDRQGKFVPGSAQQIVAPQFLTEYRPDTVVLTNPLYEAEIKQQVHELGLNCNFYCI